MEKREYQTMKVFFPIQRSILDAKAIGEYAEHEYDIGHTTTSILANIGLNDTYVLATSKNKRYILRVSRAATRSSKNSQYEIDALCHLHDKKVPVAAPMRRKDNDYLGIVEAPEGQRYTCLFRFAPGNELTYQDTNQATFYGNAEAIIHAATDDFRSQQDTPPLDIENMIDVPLRALRPFLIDRPGDWDYLFELAGRLRHKLEALPLGSLDYGFCHGDLHGWNAHIDLDGTVTFFDFDCCAPGWRAYDMATFLWAATLRRKEDERWPLFVQGYKKSRPLQEVDWNAVPLFVGVRHFWYMGYHADEARDLAAGWLNDEYYDREIGFMRQWDNRFLGKMDAG